MKPLLALFLFVLFVPAISLAQEEEAPFAEPDILPEFPGGQSEMYKFIDKNMSYPSMAREMGIQGTVYVQFVVEKDGSLTNFKVRKGIGGGCDEEAMRVLKKMPNWTPGQKAGKTVRCYFNVPIKFKLV